MGKGKNAICIDFLRSKNITFDEDKLRAMIESAVFEINNVFHYRHKGIHKCYLRLILILSRKAEKIDQDI